MKTAQKRTFGMILTIVMLLGLVPQELFVVQAGAEDNVLTSYYAGKGETSLVPGDIITYMIQSENNSGSVSNVVITDVIPTGTDYVEGSAAIVSVPPGATGSITFAEPTDQIFWTINNVAAGGSFLVSFQVIVPVDVEVKVDTIQNTANVAIDGVSRVSNSVEDPVFFLSRISISKAPTKTVYVEGESFDKSGMVVTAHYSNGTSAAVTDYSVIPADSLTAGTTEVYIAYFEKPVTGSAKVPITVVKKTVLDRSYDSSDENLIYRRRSI